MSFYKILQRIIVTYKAEQLEINSVEHWVVSWCCGRESDSRSRGRGFESQPGTTA